MQGTVQITNVGGQALPVIQGILEFPCNVNYLFHSQDTKQIAERIQSVVAEKSILVELPDPNHFSEISDKLQGIVKQHVDSIFYVNISGGTKVMSLAPFHFFVVNSLPARIFHIDQNGTIYFFPGSERGQLSKQISIKQFIAYSGQRIKELTPYSQIPEDYFEAAEICRRFYRFRNKDYRSLTQQYRDMNPDHSDRNDFILKSPDGCSVIEWNEKYELLSLTLDIRRDKDQHQDYEFIGEMYLDIVLETRWFELFVLNEINRWKAIKELAWSVIMPYSEGMDKNEIDIIANLGNKLLFIECKTNVYDIKDIDKFRNASKVYGGLGSKAILITWFKPNKRIIEKCNDTNILLFHWRNPDHTPNSGQQLIDLLSKEVLRSNTF